MIRRFFLKHQFDNDVMLSIENSKSRTMPSKVSYADIKNLPSIVQRYLGYCRVIDAPEVKNFELKFKTEMYKRNSSTAMRGYSIQYNQIAENQRYFFMITRLMGLKVEVYHKYYADVAFMKVRLANLYNIIDKSGDILSKAESVTILNDRCCFAPASLIDSNISWEVIDELQVLAKFNTGKYIVAARLIFNNQGQLINFVSDDRPALESNGEWSYITWSTPISEYISINGRNIPSYGEAVYHYPQNDFVYGKFWLQNIAYNL